MAERRTWAVLIGINAYRNLPPLKNPVRDVWALRKVLIEHFGLEGRLVRVFTDKAANRKALLRLINYTIPQRWPVKPGDQLLVFFAGHADVGLKNRRKTWYIAPIDANASSGTPDWDTVITGTDIRRLEETFPGAHILNVLDACYSGMQFAAEVAKGRSVKVRSSYAIVAGRGDDPVLDEGGARQSIFTESLIAALTGWGGLGEGDNPSFRASDLDAFIQRDVPTQIRRRSLRPIQKPFGFLLKGNVQGDQFTFTPIAPRLPPSLVQLLRNDRVDARRSAVRELGALQEPPTSGLVLEALRRLSYDDSAVVRADVCSQLVYHQEPGAADALRRLAKDSDETVAIAAVRALAKNPGKDVNITIRTLNALRSPAEGRLLREINFSLAQLGEARSVRAVIRDLPNEQGSIRREIIDILRHLPGSTISRSQLTEMLESQLRSAEWRRRRAASEAVGELGLEGAVGILARLTTTDSEHYMVRMAAAEALGHIGKGPSAEAVQLALRKDVSLLVRTAAAESLGTIGGPHAVETLSVALEWDEEWRVRRAAAEACGTLRDAQAMYALRATAADPHFRVRMAVAWAIGEIGTEDGRAVLESLRSGDRSLLVKRSATRALELLERPYARMN